MAKWCVVGGEGLANFALDHFFLECQLHDTRTRELVECQFESRTSCDPGRHPGQMGLARFYPSSESLILASFPGLLRLQFLIACSMQKRREKAWGISSCDPRHDRQMSSRLLSTAKWYTRPILRSVLATKMGQAPAESYTKRMKYTQAKSHDSERLHNDRREYTQQWCNHLQERKDGTIWSFTAYITVIPQRLSFEPGCFTGRTNLSSGTCFDSLAPLKLWIRMWISCCI